MPLTLPSSNQSHTRRIARRSTRRAIIGAERLFNRPWGITKQALAGLIAMWQAATADTIEDHRPSPGRLLADRVRAAGVRLQNDAGDGEPERGYPVTEDGIACIPVAGVLTKADSWGGMSYSEVQSMVSDAVADPGIGALLLVFDSPGGEGCSDMLDCSDFLASVRALKPMAAVASDACYSAAYALASGCGPILVDRCGGVGSVGVWCAHVDLSQMMEKAGIKITYIFSGDKKVDGNPTEPLSTRARKDLQTEVDRMRGQFVDLVVKNRRQAGATSKAIYDTEAACFSGTLGIPLLADRTASVGDALALLRVALPAARSYSLASPSASAPGGLRFPAPRQPLLLAAPGASATAWLATRSNVKPHAGLAVIAERLRVEEAAMVAKYGAHVELRLMEFPAARARVSTGSGAPQYAPRSDRKITMTIVPYDGSLSGNLGGFRELYQRGCFAQGLDNDPLCLRAHDDAYVLGRKSSGTARFWEDAAGVHAECEPPDTSWANDLLVSMRRGDIFQASAAFWILQQRWEVRHGEKVRVVEKALLRDGSVVAFAAYPTTTASTSTLSASVAATSLQIAQQRLDRLRGQSPTTDLEQAQLTLDRLRKRISQ